MIDKRNLNGLLALAALSMVAATQQLPRGRASRDFDTARRNDFDTARRNDFDVQAAHQKHLASAKLTEEQRVWNDAIEAKRAAKKARKKLHIQ